MDDNEFTAHSLCHIRRRFKSTETGLGTINRNEEFLEHKTTP